MITCCDCNISQLETEFGLIRGGPKRRLQCKECCRRYGRQNYEAKKDYYFAKARVRDSELDELINSCKTQPCMDCGVSYPPYVMDFDHRDPTQKFQKISTMRRRKMAFTKIIAEIEKCDVVCSNCHRERTNQQNPARYSV